MNKTTKGILAGVAGGALLLGTGGTFALWSDSRTVPGGTITSGTLGVTADAMTWFDASPDRADATEVRPGLSWEAMDLGADEMLPAGVMTEFDRLTGDVEGHPIDLSGWLAVPGDFVLGESVVVATVKGDNLRAALTVDFPHGVKGSLAEGLGVRTVVVEEDGAGNFVQVLDAGQAGEARTLDLESGATHLRAYVVANFPSDISEQKLVDAAATLSQVDVTLKQVR